VGAAPEIPVLAAAALDRPSNVKGGPYTEGMSPGAGHCGLVRVQPQGDEIRVVLEARTDDGSVLAGPPRRGTPHPAHPPEREFTRPIR